MQFLSGNNAKRRAAFNILGGIALASLAACGGGGGSDSSSGSAGGYTASGEVSGLNGQVKLQYNNQVLTLNQNGAFQLPGTFENNSDIQLSVQESPFTQTCVLANPAPRHVSSANVSDINISCVPLGQLTGHVAQYFTGANIDGAQIKLMATSNGQPIVVAQATSDANGQFSINGIGVSDRFVLSVVKAGFGEQGLTYSNTSNSPNLDSSIALVPAQNVESFDPTAAKVLQINGADVVSLPANALLRADGTGPASPVTANIAIIDPSSDTSVMPGNYQTLDTATGTTRQIESFGALSVRFTDSSGQALQLAAGATATISIPLSAATVPANAPATIPLFYFNESTGYWVEEGSATLQQVGGAYFYVGQVNHFTVWNADRIYETIFVNGCVNDAAGNPAALVHVGSSGQNYIGSSSVITDIAGQFSIPVRINSTVLISALAESQSRTQIVTTATTTITLSECLTLASDAASVKLTWGENPTDLDSHLYGPNDAGGQFHIYFGDDSALVGSTLFSLDVDDTSGFGPEITSIPSFPVPGTYSYYVNLYSGIGTIDSSPARVELNMGGAITVFSPASASGPVTRNWHVFDIVVDSALHAVLVPVQQFITAMPVLVGDSGGVQLESVRAVQRSASRPGSDANRKVELLSDMVKRKYYAE